MSRTALVNALAVGLMALVLGTAHLLGPSDLEAADLVAEDLAAAPLEVASWQQQEQRGLALVAAHSSE